MKKLHLSRNLMIVAIVLIAAFQCYWLSKQYKDEYRRLESEMDVAFKVTMDKLQTQRFERDTFLTGSMLRETGFDSLAKMGKKPRVFIRQDMNTIGSTKTDQVEVKPVVNGHELGSFPIDATKIDSVRVFKTSAKMPVPPPGLIEVFVKQRLKGDSNIIIKKDSSGKTIITKLAFNGNYTFSYTGKDNDSISKMTLTRDAIPKMIVTSLKQMGKKKHPKDSTYVRVVSRAPSPSPIIRFLRDSKTLNDSIPVATVDSAFKAELAKTNKKMNYHIVFDRAQRDTSAKANLTKEMVRDTSKEFITSKQIIGYNTPYAYQAKFSNIFGFILQKMSWQLSGSFLLLAFVVISFFSLYRNLLAQRRLADMKNEFISNITHELKTPIATVSVAIEALKSFGGIASPERTKEYLDISASELQRLSLLVDKVLKLSMFENKEIELKKEPLDLNKLLDEVLNTMKLQFEKHQAVVDLKTDGTNFIIHADRLHVLSVLYNLLDNAMKYSKASPSISIEMKQLGNEVSLAVIDKGIGIPAEYKEKVFEKFFRVPTGNKHNVKGYGLGLSYVYHVMEKHNGSIQVVSEEGNGSTFTVKFPTA